MIEPVPALGLVAAAALLSAALILLLKPLLVRFLLARPNARSSHREATPQGAGIAVVIAMLATLGGAAVIFAPLRDALPSLVPVLAGAAALTVLGTLDDARHVPAAWRLIGHFAAALVMVASLPDDFRLLPDFVPLLLERGLLVLGTVGCINAVNFLDGIDWMTVAEIVPIAAAVAVLQALGAVPMPVGLLALALLGAMLGFALFNKHPAQVFLGDAGSLPIGLLLAFLLIYVARVNLAAAALLPLYIVADAGLTLARRALHKEPVFSAHRSHFYQRATVQGFSVPQVTARVFLLGLLLAALAIDAVIMKSTTLRPSLACAWCGGDGFHAPRARERAQMTRMVLITGASGFIGAPLARALAKQGWQVRGAARNPAAIPAAEGVERVALPDLGAPADWAPLLERRQSCGASRRHRARAGQPAGRALYPHQCRGGGRACGRGTRAGRAARVRLLGAGAGRAFRRPPDPRERRA